METSCQINNEMQTKLLSFEFSEYKLSFAFLQYLSYTVLCGIFGNNFAQPHTLIMLNNCHTNSLPKSVSMDRVFIVIKSIHIITVWDYAEILPKSNLLIGIGPHWAYVTEGIQKARAPYFALKLKLLHVIKKLIH